MLIMSWPKTEDSTVGIQVYSDPSYWTAYSETSDNGNCTGTQLGSLLNTTAESCYPTDNGSGSRIACLELQSEYMDWQGN